MIRALSVQRAIGAPSGRVAVRVTRRVSTRLAFTLSMLTAHTAIHYRATCGYAQEKEEHCPAAFILHRSWDDHFLRRQRFRRIQVSAIP